MAFSFRIGTKWCHDFPKLARESGFYFNTHRSRIRVDWNRISNIDIDRIIRERDFHTIDDNVNSVIDYCLESEYDVKILDPNFVKLFRLAQLAVEYLLYCKEYLDHSVIILKDELRLKIEENVKLKKEISTLEEVAKNLKEKAKDRSKLIETKIGDCNGELYKCPHCPKTFISSMFVSAHILRRHAYMSDLCTTSSPIHEHYRNETERLHNEIKSLKERLNETEKVIRNESEKVTDRRTIDYDRRLHEKEVESFKHDINKSEEHQEYKGYQEEIKNLKTMLFDEIHNLRQKEKTMYERTSETNVQTLMNQQEKEFQKLKNQLFDKLTPDIESMHAKLCTQENYWKSKIEHLENQHYKDVEKLTAELKLTQKAADDIKAEYESKVSDLERQTAIQSNILTEQSKQLHSLSHEINISQLSEKSKNAENNLPKESDQMSDQPTRFVKKPDQSDLKQKDHVDTKAKQIIVGNTDSTIVFPLTLQNKISKSIHTLYSGNRKITYEGEDIKQKTTKSMKSTKFENKKNVIKNLKNCSSSDISEFQDSVHRKGINYEMKHANYDSTNQLIMKPDLNKSSTNELEDTINSRSMSQKYLSNVKNSKQSEDSKNDLTSETNSESVISDLHTQSESESTTIIDNTSPVHEHKTYPLLFPKFKNNSFHKRLQTNLQDAFEQKLKDLGIDPEWQGIPKATFKQKMDILKHHQKITMKKLPKYNQIKARVVKEVLNKISRKGKLVEHTKKLPSHKLVTNVKSTTMKTFNDKKNHKNGNYASAIQVQDIVQSKLYTTPEIDSSIKNISENEPSPIKSTNIPSYKDIESLIKLSPNSIKSLKSIQHMNSQGIPTKKDSLSKMKALFDSEQLKITTDRKGVLDVISIENDNADNSNIQPELENISISPKYNKSALKSTSASTSSLTKKKVIFDLANDNDKESLFDYNMRSEELNGNNWNTLSASDDKGHLSERESHKSKSNILLKTAQSDKIAEITTKLEAQLSMVRQKPVGSVETIFSSKYMQDRKNHSNDNQQVSSTSISSQSHLESPFRTATFNPKVTNDALPQPASRNLKSNVSETLHAESISEISDLDSDIDKILKLE